MIIFTSNALSNNDDPEKVSYGEHQTSVQFPPPDDRDDYPDDLAPTGKPDRCD